MLFSILFPPLAKFQQYRKHVFSETDYYSPYHKNRSRYVNTDLYIIIPLPQESENSVGGGLSRRSLVAYLHCSHDRIRLRETSKDVHITDSVR
jgi:hypothetical protein